MFQNLRYGVRLLLNAPGFTVIAVLTLSLGIGANTALFSVVNAVLLRPLPYQEPGRLALIWESLPKQGFFRKSVSPANYADWKEENRIFEGVAAMLGEDINLTGGSEPERIPVLRVTGEFFPLLGARPFLGRTLTRDDDQPGANGAVVISYRLWQRRFGGAADSVGKKLSLNGESHTLVGVMPPDFRFLDNANEAWLPLRLTSQEAANRGGHYLKTIARLKPGVTSQQAQAELDAIAARQQQLFPDENKDRGAYLSPLREELVGDIKPSLLMLFGASGFVLLIACVNVANLMLARAAGRQKELAVRVVLGAGRLRLLWQFVAESVPLAVLSGGAGLLLAFWGVGLLKSSMPPSLSRVSEIHLDSNVLGFTLAISLLTGLLFSLAPVLRSTRVNLNEILKAGGRGAGRQTRLRSWLVISEMALALILLIGAGLMLRSFARLLKVDPGFRPDHVLSTRLTLAGEKDDDPAQVKAFFDQVTARIAALPGVQSVGVTAHLPLTGGPTMTFTVETQPAPKESKPVTGGVRGEYFHTLGIPLLKGRLFNERDTPTAAGVVIVSQTFAQRTWPGGDPLGKRMWMGPKYVTSPWLTVVGVVGDVRQYGVSAPAESQVYLPATQTDDFAARELVLRTSVDPLSLVAAVRREIQAVDKDMPVTLRTMEEVVADSIGQNRFYLLLLGIFASVALLLSAIGIYGVISYGVAQSTREIGIRLALGAQARDVLKLVMVQAAVLTLTGVALGLAGAFGLTRLLTNLLYEVKATDGPTFIAVPALLLGVALVAGYLPARKATKVDPMIALRHD
jgi:putative ABC transport system permease protein